MKSYLSVVDKVFKYGDIKVGRNGVTRSISGAEFSHDMREGFPILTLREMNLAMAVTELRFFIQGLSDKRWLQDRGCKFWDKWCNKRSLEYIEQLSRGKRLEEAAKATNDLGPIYGVQWRGFNGIDQLQAVIDTLKTNPNSRRMLVSAWNPEEIEEMALPPCHDSFQFISNGVDLDIIWRQRSCDVAVGLPYDILLYALLLTLVAKEVGMQPRYLVGHLGDTHVYGVNEARLDVVRQRQTMLLPELTLEWPEGMTVNRWAMSNYDSDQWSLKNYEAHPKVFFEVVA